MSERVKATVWIEPDGYTRASWESGSVATGRVDGPVSRWLAAHMWPESAVRECWEYIGHSRWPGSSDEVREYRFERIES